MNGQFTTLYIWILPVLTVITVHCAASGMLGRNHIAGIRTPSLLASDAGWRAGHRAAIGTAWLTVPVALGGTVVALMMTNPGLRGLVILGCSVASVAIVIRAAVVANAAARRVDGS